MTTSVHPACDAGRLAALFLALALVVGCQPPRTDPEEALRAFLTDLRSGRADSAWAALTTASQKELERRHELLRTSKGAASPKPAQLLFEDLGLMMVNAPESIAIASPPGQEVMLRVSVKEGRSADIRMVREGERWKVDLVGSLQPAPPLDEKLSGSPSSDTATAP